MSFVYDVFAYDFHDNWHLSISCTLNQSADWVIDVTVKWHTFLITVFVLICSFKNKRFLYYCYNYCDMKVEFQILLQFEAFLIWCFFCVLFHWWLWCGHPNRISPQRNIKNCLGGCLCKKNNQTPMTGQDREISKTPPGKISIVLWLGEPRQRTIEILPLDVWDFSILTRYRC